MSGTEETEVKEFTSQTEGAGREKGGTPQSTEQATTRTWSQWGYWGDWSQPVYYATPQKQESTSSQAAGQGTQQTTAAPSRPGPWSQGDPWQAGFIEGMGPIGILVDVRHQGRLC